MKRKKSLLLITLLSLLSTNKVYAACTEAELNHFKEIENQYSVTYEYDKNTDEYSIIYYMPEPNKYAYYIFLPQDTVCTSPALSTLKCTGKNLSGKYEMIIQGTTSSCTDDLKKESLEIPKYNKYYGREECQGIEEFSLCQETYNKDVTEEDFKSRTDLYKESKANNPSSSTNNNNNNNDNDKNNNIKENTFFEKIVYYVQNNLTKVIIITVFIILLVITGVITIKSIKKSRRLE